jgi:hypothetical protein
MNVKPFWGIMVAIGVSLGAGEAVAQNKHFEEAAQDASRVDSGAALASLFWSQLSDCSGEKNDLRRRQCEGVRAARAKAVSGSTVVIDGDARSFRVAGFDEKKNELKLELTGCIACVAPVEVAGGRFFVVAERGAVEAGGDGPSAAALYATTRTFKSKAWADRWADEIVPRLRAEYLVEVPAKAKTWTGGKHKALRVKVVGFRVYDPCDGKIICADPPSNPTPADKNACGENVMAGADETDETPAKPSAPAAPKLPASLSTYMINNSLAPARKAAQQCFITYGVSGNASFRITISAQGQVVALQQKGDFVDTPTGACLDKAVKAVTFPPTRKKSTTIDYPFMLR